MRAAEEGQLLAVVLFLDKQADVNAVNRKGRSALSFSAALSLDDEADAARVSQLEVMEILVAQELTSVSRTSAGRQHWKLLAGRSLKMHRNQKQ